MRSLAIAWKDVRHVYRSVAGLAMMLLAPLILAGAIGAAFGSGDNFSISAVKTVVVDQDCGRRGRARPARRRRDHGRSDQPGAGRPADRVPASPPPRPPRTAVDTGEAEVAVIIPAGTDSGPFGRDALAAAGRDLQGPHPHDRSGDSHLRGAGRRPVAQRGAGRGLGDRAARRVAGSHRPGPADRPRTRRRPRRTALKPRPPTRSLWSLARRSRRAAPPRSGRTRPARCSSA